MVYMETKDYIKSLLDIKDIIDRAVHDISSLNLDNRVGEGKHISPDKVSKTISNIINNLRKDINKKLIILE